MPVATEVREGVIALAREAAAAILRVYAADFDVAHKDDASPLTDADLAAHRCIVAGLQRLTPDIPVLSEESAHTIASAVRRGWRRLWVVDPLDGTREFVKRNGEFTVNIALVDSGAPVFGVIQAPVGGVLWHGAPGLGAFRRVLRSLDTRGMGGAQDERERDIPLRTRIPATAPLRVAGSRSYRDPRTTALMARIAADTGETETVAQGSSLKFCRLAEGGMDVYPRFGPTSEWDTAAGQAILEAAGGCLLDPRGRPFRYNQRDTLLNGDFIALGDPALPWKRWITETESPPTTHG